MLGKKTTYHLLPSIKTFIIPFTDIIAFGGTTTLSAVGVGTFFYKKNEVKKGCYFFL